MTNANRLHPSTAPSSCDPPAPAERASSRLIAEVARLRGEIRRLESTLRMRDHATALVLHELRQPLNALVLAAGRLEAKAVGPEKSCADRLCAAALRLDGLVADLGDTSFLESGRFTLHVKSANVAHLVAGAVARLGSAALISVEGDIPPVEVDSHRVEQVLTNLLSNAQKYGSRGAPPCISIVQRDDDVVVTVLNDGAGLTGDERIKVFDPYYRGRERRPEAKGLGLGLYICKRLIEEHGGQIWTDGDALHTRFSFTLPIREEVQRPSETRISVHRPGATPRERGDEASPQRG